MCKRKCLKKKQIKELIEIAEYDYADDPVELALTIDTLKGLLGEAHHVYTKALYHEKAYDLDNGVTVCWRCHRDVIHSTRETYRLYLHMFKCYMRRKITQAFNAKYQGRMKPK